MKRLFLLSLMSISMWMAQAAVTNTIYLDVSKCADWQGAYTYMVYLSAEGTGYVMTQMSGNPNIYYYKTSNNVQQNPRFGYSSHSKMDATIKGGWSFFNQNCDKQIERHGWSPSTPCLQLGASCKNDDAKWVGYTPDSEDKVVKVENDPMDRNCTAGTFTIPLKIQMSGNTAMVIIEADFLPTPIKIENAPVSFTRTLSCSADAGATVSIKVSAYANAAATKLNNSITHSITAPNDCETKETITLCSNITTTDLSCSAASANDYDSIQWYKDGVALKNEIRCELNGAEVANGVVYTAEHFTKQVDRNNNLMRNGSFEEGYVGFSVDKVGSKPLMPITKNGTPVIDPYHVYSNNYDNGSDYGHYYMISSDASRVQDGVNCTFYPIKAYDGQYFYIADASSSGYVWKAETKDNPNLIVKKGTKYVFSYWCAYPNTGKELDDPAARLQFKIELELPTGDIIEIPLGTDFVVKVDGDLYSWHQQITEWTSPFDCNNVTIGVVNLTNSNDGNDFCLDDIIFQPIDAGTMVVSHRDIFTIQTKNCDTPCPDVIEDRVDTVVCSSEMPFTWRGYEYTIAASRVWMEKSARRCDSIEHKWRLTTKDCSIPCPDVIEDRVDTVVCDTLLPITWRGYTFAAPDTYEWMEYSPRRCDSINHVWTLKTEQCERPTPPTPPTDCVEGLIFRKWQDVLFVNNGPEGLNGEAASYQWYQNEVPIAGANAQSYYNPSGMSGKYSVVVTKKDGTTVTACAITFDEVTRSVELNQASGGARKVSERVYYWGNYMKVVRREYEDGSVETVKTLKL